MSTLLQAPLAGLIERLFAEAEERDEALHRRLAAPAAAGVAAMPDSADYRAFYARLADDPLAVSRETGRLLYVLARSSGARTIVEFGTSFGTSTLHLAAALRDNGGGRLIGSEFEPSKVERARANLAAGGLADLVEVRAGDALETLSRDLPGSIDLVLLDGAKSLYEPILDRLAGRIRAGGLIVADNADRSPGYLARVRAADRGYLSIPFAADVELSIKLGPPAPG